ncbi:MAG: tetratricopeptide 4, partial [Thermomicrobiales bacterium]|nr:tetratricopeptide 4 [Thermomicrobiales bacterium]
VEAATRAMPWRYPVQGRYFAQLEQGTLGFDRVATFHRPPSIGNVPIDDSGADESFINYDHPRVSIYERSSPPSREAYDAAMSWALQRPWFPDREPEQPTLLLPGPVGENPSVNDARWSASISHETPAAIAIWLVLLAALLVVGLPLARLFVPGAPDHGWGLARTFALVITGYAVWLGASLEVLRFRAVWVVLSLVVTGALGWWVWRRSRRAFAPRSGAGPRFCLHAEIAFWLTFLLFLAFRLVTPDGWHPFWGGEKPMEFAQINAIGRSAFFPPYDPWYADGYVNYYYYGFYLMAFLGKAVGIPPEIGFNLALPTVMGLIASGGFSVAAAISRGLTRSPRLAVAGGWCGVVALVLLGNLTALRGILEGGPGGADHFLFWTWNGSRAIDYAITEFPFFSGLYADLHAHVIALPLTIAVIALCREIALLTPIAGRDSPNHWPAWAPVTMRLAVLALLLGSLSATNAWDVPVYAVLAVASVFMATTGIADWRTRLLAFGGASCALGLMAWLLFVPFHRHFVALFGSVALVEDSTDLGQLLSHFGALIAISAIGLTTLLIRRGAVPQWSALGIWIALAVGVLGLLLLGSDIAILEKVGSVMLLTAFAGPPLAAAILAIRTVGDSRGVGQRRAIVALTCVGGAVALASAVADRAVFGLAFALGVAAAVGWLSLASSAERFVCLLLAAAFFTTAGVEILVVADDLIGSPWYRMNTVFKFYNQIWVLLAVSGSALVALMVRESIRRRVMRSQLMPPFLGLRSWARFGVAVAVVAALASLAYPALATGPRLALQFTPGTPSGTLDALGWMESGVVPVVGDPEVAQIGYAGDAAAIDWLLANVSGTPVIAEASIGPYRCNGSRISAATGLPTIIGWERHQQQQRYPDDLPARVKDVRTLYTSPDPDEKTAILRRYNIEYVVVGELERLYPIANNECTPSGSAAGIAAFDAMLGSTLEVAHASAGTVIYRVLPIATA